MGYERQLARGKFVFQGWLHKGQVQFDLVLLKKRNNGCLKKKSNFHATKCLYRGIEVQIGDDMGNMRTKNHGLAGRGKIRLTAKLAVFLIFDLCVAAFGRFMG